MMDNINYSQSRLDIEIYVMGEMSYEFMCYLGECFKENFFETLSWGNFRRFQLILWNNKNWINVYFILIKNDLSADVLINSFKIYEKRNFTLLMYNANDQRSEKNIQNIYETLISERNKFYDGIFNEDSVVNNLKKITNDSTNKNLKLSPEIIKDNLKFLINDSKEENLIYKIGFYPNLTNKKTKNIKKSDSNNVYYINGDYFYINGHEENTDFTGLLGFILIEQFKKLKIENNSNLTNFMDVIKFNPKNLDKSSSKNKNKLFYFLKMIEWLIVIYIIFSIYKFIVDNK